MHTNVLMKFVPKAGAVPSRLDADAARGLLILASTLALAIGLMAGGLWRRGGGKDFICIYLQTRSSAETGASPYSLEAVFKSFRDHYQQTGEQGWMPPTGAYLPPQDMVLVYPWSLLPWPVASRGWSMFLAVMAASCAPLAWTFRRGEPLRWPVSTGAAVVAALTLNPLTLNVLALGQQALLACAGIALGQWAYERGRPWLGAVAWSLTVFKPQIGIACMALAFALGGWRRVLQVSVVVGVLNLLGGLITTGNPLLVLEYPGHVMSHLEHDRWHSVASTHVVSWNATLYGLTGIDVELTNVLILISYAAWAALVAARAAAAGMPRATPEYWLAACAAGILLCARSHGYDLVLFVLFAPLMITLWKEGARLDVLLLGAVMAASTLPRSGFDALAARTGLGTYATVLLVSYRAYAVAIAGAYLIARGPAAPRPAGPEAGAGGPSAA